MTDEPMAGTVVRLRTGAWYSDAPLELSFPLSWDVRVHRPATPAPLSPDEIATAVRSPRSGPPLRELARGARRVSVLVDDLTRPTPAAAILPQMLSELAAAGVPASSVTVLVATGAHRVALDDLVLRAKLGDEAVASCRVVVHDHRAATTRVGTTSYRTPVHLDSVVAGSDLLVGVGGVYPQHTVGFGGGAKIVLGALGTRSIAALHYKHPGGHGAYTVHNDFRRDVGEMARLVGLRFVALGHVDAERQLVRLVSGDPLSIHDGEVAFARQTFLTPLPGDADLVVANAYPMDVSLTFAHSKGVIPFSHTRAGASRVLLAGCPEGIGRHDLFPVAPTRLDRVRHLARKATVAPKALPSKVPAALARRLGPRRAAASPSRTPIMWYPGQAGPTAGLVPARRWSDVLETVRARHGDRPKVVIYPCAPIQVMDLDDTATSATLVEARPERSS